MCRVLIKYYNLNKYIRRILLWIWILNQENKVGSTVGELFGSLGTNTTAWSNWIKQNLSTSQGIGDVITNLDKLVDTNDIINYLDSNGQVSQAIIDAAIKNNTLPKTYAAAITQMAQGMSAGVNTAASLATQSSITAATSGAEWGCGRLCQTEPAFSDGYSDIIQWALRQVSQQEEPSGAL